jgi:hypothetical protein
LYTLLLPTLLLIGVSLCEVLELVVSFPSSPNSLKTDFVCISYCIFGFGGFTGSFLWEVLTSPYLVFYLLLILGLYVVHWIGISLSFSKSPSLLKSEFGRKSHDRFHLSSFSVGANPVAPGFSPGNRFRAGGAGLYASRSGARTGATPETLPEHVFGAGPALAGLCTGRSSAEPSETDF